jgi:Bacteriocin-protection, YdeI or OmpD-Associated
MLVKKLHVKPGMRVAVVNAPPGFDRTMGRLPSGVTRELSLKGPLDLALLFVASKKELRGQWPRALKSLKADGALWVAYPKKASGMNSDLAMGSDWEVTSGSPWQPVASIAVDGTWTGVRFKNSPGLDRVREQRQDDNERDADGTICVDRRNRIVRPPVDLQKLLDGSATARAQFDTLSFTHRREYVKWIIEAKKPETRTARLAKTIDMLSKGKKNPSDK